MIFGEGRVTRPVSLEEGSSSFGDALTASFQEAISDNVSTKALDYFEKRNIEDKALREGKRFMPKEEAQSIAQKQGVEIQNMPDSIDEDSLNFLINRQYKKKVRNEIISSSGSSLASITGSIAGSLTDPLNIATSFIPVVGQAKIAAIAARAGLGARIAGRAAVGAVEGAVGAAFLEPASYLLSQELGDDYTVANSFANITIGTVMGAGLHTVVGAGVEIKNKVFPELTPIQKLSKQFDNMSVEQRQNYIKSTVAQMIEDRPIDVGLVDAANKVEVKAKLDELDLKIKQARSLNDESSVNILTQKYEALALQLDDASIPPVKLETPEIVAATDPKKIDSEYIKKNFENEVEGRQNAIEQIKQAVAKQDAVTFKDSPVVKIEGESLVLQSGEKVDINKAVDEGVVLESRNPTNQSEINVEGQAILDSKMKAVPNASELQKIVNDSQTLPMSKFIDQDIDTKNAQAQETLAPRDHTDSYEAAKREVDYAVQEAIESAKASGAEIEPIIKEMDAYVKEVDEYADFMRKVAGCAIVKGSA